MALTNERVLLYSRPKGIPKKHHFQIDTVAVPELSEGEFLVRNRFLSVDPAMRGWVNETPNYLPPVEIGAVMRSFAVGEVVASCHPQYAEGERVVGMLGWQRYSISDGHNIDRKVVERDIPSSLSLGVLGLNGITAYFGLLEICDPRPGETVVVSTAAGAVGSAVGQIARLKGARVVGITSSAVKLRHCLESFGYNAVINYRDEDVAASLKRICPDGVNCFFDNTCGSISDAVMANLARGARIAVCGTSALPDWDPIPLGPRVHRQLLVARARMQGFVIFDYKDRFTEAIDTLANWVRDGKIIYREHVLDGIRSAPGAIELLYQGSNEGKLLIRVD